MAKQGRCLAFSADRTYNLYRRYPRWRSILALRAVAFSNAILAGVLGVVHVVLAGVQIRANGSLPDQLLVWSSSFLRFFFLLPTLASILLAIIFTVWHIATTKPASSSLTIPADSFIILTVLATLVVELIQPGPCRMWISTAATDSSLTAVGMLQLTHLIWLLVLASVHVTIISAAYRMRRDTPSLWDAKNAPDAMSSFDLTSLSASKSPPYEFISGRGSPRMHSVSAETHTSVKKPRAVKLSRRSSSVWSQSSHGSKCNMPLEARHHADVDTLSLSK